MTHEHGPTDNKPDFARHFDTLKGLRPGLVKELAKLHVQSFDDVSISAQVMPYGDRAVLSVYGYFSDSELGVISPDFTELTEAAYLVVIKAVRNEDISRVLDSES